MGTSRLIISDEERRQAASRLREELALMRDRRDWYRANEDPTAAGNLAYRNIADSVIPGSNIGSGYIEVVERLADLIDRPKAKREGVGNYWLCRHCGAFNRKDAITDCFGVIPSRGCGNCGREWER